MELPAQTGATPEQVYLHLVIIIILSDATLELVDDVFSVFRFKH